MLRRFRNYLAVRDLSDQVLGLNAIISCIAVLFAFLILCQGFRELARRVPVVAWACEGFEAFESHKPLSKQLTDVLLLAGILLASYLVFFLIGVAVRAWARPTLSREFAALYEPFRARIQASQSETGEHMSDEGTARDQRPNQQT